MLDVTTGVIVYFILGVFYIGYTTLTFANLVNISLILFILTADSPGNITIDFNQSLPWIENSNNTAFCNVSQGNPPETYNWTIGEEGTVGHQNTCISIYTTKQSHNELIRCEVWNNYTLEKNVNISKEENITVECKYQ